MTYSTYSFTQEPSQASYENILDLSLNLSSIILLIVNRSMKTSDRCDRAIARSNEYLLEEKELSEWPGTILYAGTAIVRKYLYNNKSVNAIKGLVNSLYEWNLPDLPEDFCLLRDDLTPWLVTISHKSDGYFYPSQSEIDSLLEFLPELEKYLVKD